MYIHSIEINNYRSIGSNPAIKLDISDLTVLSGINDTGKTSALSASFIALNNINDRGVDTSELLVGSNHRKGYDTEESAQVVQVAFRCTEEDIDKIWAYINHNDRFENRLKGLKENGIDIEGEKVKSFIKDAVILLNLPLNWSPISSYDDFVDFKHWNNCVESFFGFEDNREFSDYLYNEINIATALERSVKGMNCLFVQGVTRSNKQILIEAEDQGSQLVTYFKEISSEKGRIQKRYSFFMDCCKILFPELVRIEINNPTGDENTEDLFLTWNQNGNEKYQPLSRSGDGIYNTLYLLAKLLNNFSSMNIVFIDEPEIGLHPMLQKRFIRLLRKISRNFPIKWVLATHSPFILQSLKGKEKLYLIKHDGIQTHCQDIDITSKEIVFNTLGAYLPLALSAKGVIFVEGQTEVTVLTILLKKVGLNIEEQRILIIPLGGENLFKIAAKDLKILHEKSMVIIDSDLPQSEEQGGNVKQVKLNYEAECAQNNVEFLMLKEYRTLENMYQNNILAEVLNRDVETLNYGAYDEVPGITERNKVAIGESVANTMSKEEAENFPLIKEIKRWWTEK
ncbi:ATP-dependent nuclease [Bacillus cereus]|uniref:ATP-dependent nuclease n=1 Tax=Bacillus cereus TaxID=1396 RepID=UPI001F09CD5A|nr:AAA family ATPase [Bacillus cereus]MCU5770680.1 AAA family ATPase [Bacillus cereus]HDR7002693.1 AAA family ATPase [Bacillus cereus]HDR7021079.1 AAA family ATPase [Bacillus cereus]